MSDRANRSRKSEADVNKLKAYLGDMQDARATEVELVKARLGNRLAPFLDFPRVFRLLLSWAFR